MKKTRIPLYYHPTTVLIIDDNQRFLKSIVYSLNENVSYLLNDSPQKALAFLQQEYVPTFKADNYLTINLEENPYGANYNPVKINVASLYEKIYRPERFNDITTIIIDYAMPGMTGIDFCEQLVDSPIKKFMLTGEADEKTATNAFNNRTIDKFLLKSTPNSEELINKGIEELQYLFFSDITFLATETLALGSATCLTDPVFISVFEEVCRTKEIVEYYFIEDSGSFLMLDIKGKPYWLIVKSPDDLEMFAAFAEESGASKSLVEQIKEGGLVPYFPNPQECQNPAGDEWKSYCYPGTKLEGKKLYFYSLIENIPNSNLDQKRIVSYRDFLNKK